HHLWSETKTDIQRQLKRLNKPALKSIKSPDGDIIDCVHIKNQPAFDHPFFRNHTIQMRPSFHPEGLSFDDVSSKPESEITQLWHLNGRCPEETIPIRRTKEEDLLRASSVANYGRSKYPQFDTTDTNKTAIQENAIVFVKEDKYYGTKATINVWKPQIQEQVEFSFSQLEIFGGNATTEINAILAGWMVSYTLYGDYNSRLFAFFYNNKVINQTRGCYNLLCSPGFVQINKEIALGGSINPISVYAGSQYELHFLVWKDIKGGGDWWLQVGNKYLMGYWPASLFVSLSESASQILWGGLVINQQKKEQHTSTQMGSGHFPEEGFSRASYFRNLQIVDGSNILRFPKQSYIAATKPNCYNVTNFINNFYYGGPGRSPNCP
ncbi:protein neprosin, partial [Quercus suber]|uniref:protein neprosin n=1 Tax=Quercus suber TaxID=58331 RepID=UPI0032E01494